MMNSGKASSFFFLLSKLSKIAVHTPILSLAASGLLGVSLAHARHEGGWLHRQQQHSSRSAAIRNELRPQELGTTASLAYFVEDAPA